MLSLTVVEARKLQGKDPYVLAQLATRYIRTRTIQKCQDPFWGDSYVMYVLSTFLLVLIDCCSEVDDEVKEKVLTLQVTVMDDDFFALKDRVLGKIVLTFVFAHIVFRTSYYTAKYINKRKATRVSSRHSVCAHKLIY